MFEILSQVHGPFIFVSYIISQSFFIVLKDPNFAGIRNNLLETLAPCKLSTMKNTEYAKKNRYGPFYFLLH